MKKILFYLFLIFLFSCDKNEKKNYFQKLEGSAFGTTFHITYEDKTGQIFEKQVDSLIHLMNKSLSTYMPNSDISKINNGDSTIVVDELFLEVFEKSNRIYKETNGAFDPTIGILVNAWGFGPGKMIENLDSTHISSMLEVVGFDKVKIENNRVIKKYKETYFDFNALAKGFAVDVIGRFLEDKNVNNYMVEIGGEIRARGFSQKNIPWIIAVEEPNFDGNRSFQTKIDLLDESIATSGNYRKFKIDAKTGKKYAHIIDPTTGYPIKSNLLSATVISNIDCADVDGYATALMAMGLTKGKEFLRKHPDLKAFLIFSDQDGEIKTYATENFLKKRQSHNHN